jgi:hypothetical protein
MDASPLPKSDLLIETNRLAESFAGRVVVDQVDVWIRAGLSALDSVAPRL